MTVLIYLLIGLNCDCIHNNTQIMPSILYLKYKPK